MPDAPVAALIAVAPELARRWAVALMEQLPPERMGEVPLEQIAVGAPAAISDIARALSSAEELEPLAGPAAAVVLACAPDLPAAIEAIEALRGVLWDALEQEVREPHGRRLAELSDRLAHICAGIAAAAARGADVRPRVPAPAPPVPGALVDERAGAAGAERIEIRDARGEEPAGWQRALASRVERLEERAGPFAVLLAEVADIERLRRAWAPEELSLLLGGIEDALASQGESLELLGREAPGRYWLAACDTDVAGANALAERLAGAVRMAAGHRGAPLELAVGIAVAPVHGRDAATLAAHADVDLYAARAGGRPTAQSGEPPWHPRG